MRVKDIQIGHQHLCDLFDALGVGAIVVSPNRRIIEINRSAEMLATTSADKALGKSCYDIFQTTLCGGTCQLEKENKEALTLEHIDIEITDPQNESRSLTKIIFPIYDSDNKLLACMEVFQDHSAFKDLIKRIWFEDRRLKNILDTLDIGVITLDRGSHITLFNTTAETITGYGRKEILGKSYADLFQSDAEKDNLLLKQTIHQGEPSLSNETWLLTKSGDHVPVRSNYTALRNKEGRIVGSLVTIADLSIKHELDTAIKDRYTFFDMVGRDPAMQQLFEIVPVVAASDATILIEGPTGTGKDILAKVIHHASPRVDKPLVKVNCAALPDNLLESEMFGYVKGAFTGADRNKPGRFQEADGGSIFLDEIGDMPLSLQAKLLRVLEDKEFYPLGGRKPTKVDVRIISATNQGLENMVKEKRFREDLYYRLNVMRFELPSLYDRKMDIPLLISHILKRLAAVKNRERPEISEDAMAVLLNHTYPGNVRELENILEHALIICRGNIITRKHLPLSLQRDLSSPIALEHPTAPLASDMETNEKNMLLTVLQEHHWHRGNVANSLQINRSTLWRKMKKYGLFRK
jgi:PAS domain S-box-containing protein